MAVFEFERLKDLGRGVGVDGFTRGDGAAPALSKNGLKAALSSPPAK